MAHGRSLLKPERKQPPTFPAPAPGLGLGLWPTPQGTFGRLPAEVQGALGPPRGPGGERRLSFRNLLSSAGGSGLSG